MNRIESKVDPSTNGHAKPGGVAPGVPASTLYDIPVEIVDAEVKLEVSRADRGGFKTLTGTPGETAEVLDYRGGRYAVAHVDPDYVLAYLLAPRNTVRHVNPEVGEGYTVTVDGRDYALTSPVVLTTEGGYKKLKEGLAQIQSP